jgi:ribosomal 50S subunit-recycling heat shock protein
MAVKLGEVETKMSADVKKTDELRVRLKGKLCCCNKVQAVKFKPSEDLKKGDKLKITIEKL